MQIFGLKAPEHKTGRIQHYIIEEDSITVEQARFYCPVSKFNPLYYKLS